jgi:hypothetical protein
MEDHLQQIRAALEVSASLEAQQAGLEACRALTAAIEEAATRPPTTPADLPPAAPAAPSEPADAASQPVVAELCDPRDVPPVEAASALPPPPPLPAPQTAAVVSAAPAALPSIGSSQPAAMDAIVKTLRSLTPDQWLDLIIEKLTAATRAMPAASPVPSLSPVAAILPAAAPQPLRFQMVSIPAASPRPPNRRR